MDFSADIRKNKAVLSAGEWVQLERVIVSELCQAQKDSHCFLYCVLLDFLHVCGTTCVHVT